MLVTEPVTQKLVCYKDTVRQQAILSKRYLFANRTAEKEDEVYPVTVKEVAEAQRAHKHYSNYVRKSKNVFLINILKSPRKILKIKIATSQLKSSAMKLY